MTQPHTPPEDIGLHPAPSGWHISARGNGMRADLGLSRSTDIAWLPDVGDERWGTIRDALMTFGRDGEWRHRPRCPMTTQWKRDGAEMKTACSGEVLTVPYVWGELLTMPGYQCWLQPESAHAGWMAVVGRQVRTDAGPRTGTEVVGFVGLEVLDGYQRVGGSADG